MLSYQIAKKVKPEYNGVDLHPATIRKYVNANIANVTAEAWGERGHSGLCVQVSFHCIQDLCSHRTDQLVTGGATLQEACGEDKPSPQAQLQAEDAPTHYIGNGEELRCIHHSHHQRSVIQMTHVGLIIGILIWSNSALQLGGLTALLPSRMISCCTSYLNLMRGAFCWMAPKEGGENDK